MQLLIWPNGKVSDFAEKDMSDDYFTVDTNNWEELESKVNNHFGNTPQAIHVITECEYWQDIED